MGIKLNWVDQSAQNLDAIEIYRSTSPIDSDNPGNPIATLPGNATGFDDTTVKNKNVYYYRVVAKKGVDRSWGPNQFTGYFAETGPGRPTPLRGDWNAALMDLIAPADFITNVALRAKVPSLAALQAGSEPTVWFKMFSKGKVFFVPNANIVTASWAQLYNAGLVYGVDGVGERPATIGAGVVNQKVTVDIGGRRYLIRCPRLSPLPETSFAAAQADTIGSEWRTTMGRMVRETVDPQPGSLTRLYDNTSLPNFFGTHYASVGNIVSVTGTKPETYATTPGGTNMAVGLVLELIMP
ncbi:hypothetical protein pEaSNUABM38_00146 [Erwinia phage pEa_SNUABM_38]|nr:hypothetical protein pEaSNUABM38_00146 [Erwinia phage pEa_SNUABM_38]